MPMGIGASSIVAWVNGMSAFSGANLMDKVFTGSGHKMTQMTEKDRRAQLIDAGFKPENHPPYMAAHMLLEAKAEAHRRHRQFLEQFLP